MRSARSRYAPPGRCCHALHGPSSRTAVELRLHLVEVADRMLVEDDDVGAEALEAPVFLRLQHLPHQRHVLVAEHAHEQDRQVAGDRVRPEARLAQLVRRNRLRAARAASRRCRARARRAARRARRRRPRCPGGAAPLWTCVMASANVRAVGARTRGTSARGLRPSRGPRPGPWRSESRTVAPGASRMRWRRLTIGSSTMPVVPESARPSRACGSAGVRPRPRKRARSVSHSSGPCGRPSRLSAWKAHAASSPVSRGRRWHSSAALSARCSVSTNSLPNAGWARSFAFDVRTISA